MRRTKRRTLIPVLRPTIDLKTKQELIKQLDSGWWGFGKKTYEFEKKFAAYVGARYCIGTSSGTSALDLCIKAYGLRGGELITPAMTFVSDAIVGEWNGMTVTFADIDEHTLCLDPKALFLTPKTKVIIAVDSHGRLSDVAGIKKAIKKSGLYTGNSPGPKKGSRPLIIEDAAHAVYTPGAGRQADITIWSFQAVKALPLWDGGAVTTNSKEVYKKLRNLTWLGVEQSTFDRVGTNKYSWNYDIVQADGIKAYMTDIQAVVAVGQLRRLKKTNAKRRAIQAYYNKALKNVRQVKTPAYSHTVQYYTMECEQRDRLSQFLAGNGISTSVHFKPLSQMTYWKKAVKRALPVTDTVWKKLLTLPVHNALTMQEATYIAKKIKEFYGSPA